MFTEILKASRNKQASIFEFKLKFKKFIMVFSGRVTAEFMLWWSTILITTMIYQILISLS